MRFFRQGRRSDEPSVEPEPVDAVLAAWVAADPADDAGAAEIEVDEDVDPDAGRDVDDDADAAGVEADEDVKPVRDREADDDVGAGDIEADEAVEPVALGVADPGPLAAETAPTEAVADAADLAAVDPDADEVAPIAVDMVDAGEPASAEGQSSPDASPIAAEMAGGDPDVPVDDGLMRVDADPMARAEAAADATVRWTVDAVDTGAVVPDERVASSGPRSRRPAVIVWSGPTAADAADPASEGRAPALRFATLHLRGGQHALARAELEALAGRSRLDEPGLLDLAEIRWRTGDLAGAGDAANALLARGNESPLALVIAAEAVAAAGRPGEARRLSSRALEVADGPLDPLFAGMPRSTIWPATAGLETAAETPRRRGRNRAGDTSGAPSTASEAFAGGRGALARGDATRAALLLGVAMRLAPEFAEDVLHAVTGRDDQPLLALVRGDALRLLGREAEALEAFDRARGRAGASGGGSQVPSGPGLFDADPALADDEGD